MTPRPPRSRPRLETLEDRTNPVSFLMNSAGNLIGIFGPAPIGGLSVVQTADNQFQIVEDNHNYGLFNVSGDLTIDLGNSTTFGLIDVDMNNHSFSGSVTINVGSNAAQPVGYGIVVNANVGGGISGNLNIHTGNGNMNVLVHGSANETTIGGSVNVQTGLGVNTVYITNATIGGNAQVNNASTTIFGSNSSVGGFLTMDSSQVNFLNASLSYNFTNGFTVGSFLAIHTGNNNLNNLLIGGGTTIFGNTIIAMGNGTDSFTLAGGSTIFGSLTYIGGNGNDIVALQANSTIFGAVSIVLGNTNLNPAQADSLDIAGTILGPSINIIGGNGTDTVVFEGNAPGAALQANLFFGNATFLLNLTHGSLKMANIIFGLGHQNFFGSLGVPPGFRLIVHNVP